MQVLRKAWQIWKRVGQFIGDFIARVILSVFYITLLLPFGLGMRFLGDRLDIKGYRPARWLERNVGDASLAQARRLF